jgi:hypothetical protein
MISTYNVSYPTWLSLFVFESKSDQKYKNKYDITFVLDPFLSTRIMVVLARLARIYIQLYMVNSFKVVLEFCVASPTNSKTRASTDLVRCWTEDLVPYFDPVTDMHACRLLSWSHHNWFVVPCSSLSTRLYKQVNYSRLCLNYILCATLTISISQQVLTRLFSIWFRLRLFVLKVVFFLSASSVFSLIIN